MKAPEKYRIKQGPMRTSIEDGPNGAFRAKSPHRNLKLTIIASNGAGWEHVSVSIREKPGVMPTWKEMCWVKDLFWDKSEAVVQFHPPHNAYVNNVRNCLHLWRKVGQDWDLPDEFLVGIKSLGTVV